MLKEDQRKGKGIMIKRLGGFCLLFIALFLFFTTAHGAQYPTKTIQIVSPFPPGGLTDVVARLLSKKLSTSLGQSVVVVNRAGGGGTVGIQGVAAAPADGYTILVTTPTIMVSPLTTKDIPFSFKDFTPINLLAANASAIAVKKDAPWKNLEEFIADAKRNPGKFTFSSAGPGTIPHLAGELFKKVTSTDITHIPMDGTAKAVTALLGGHVNMNFMAFSGVKSYVEAGSLRVLAVMSRNRLEEFPDIPTGVEKGYPKLISATWVASFVLAKTSPVIVKKLSEVFDEVLKDKEVNALLKKYGMQVENLGPKEAASFFTEEEKMLSEVIKAAKIGQ